MESTKEMNRNITNNKTRKLLLSIHNINFEFFSLDNSENFNNFEDLIQNFKSNFKFEKKNEDEYLITLNEESGINYEEIGKLILTLINLFPENYQRLLFEGLFELLNNSNELVGNYRKNVLSIVDKFKNLNFANPTIENEFYLAVSCVIGAFIGDSMGSYVEFTPPDSNNHKKVWTDKNTIFGTHKGQVTDDSEMALSLLFSLNDDGKDLDLTAFYYGLWVLSRPFDIGTTTRGGLAHFKNLVEKIEDDVYSLSVTKRSEYSKKCLINASKNNPNSLSNGFLMRHTPMTVYLYFKLKDFINEKIKSDLVKDNYEVISKIFPLIDNEIGLTHPNDFCKNFAALYDYLIFTVFTFKNEQEDLEDIVYSKFIALYNHIMMNIGEDVTIEYLNFHNFLTQLEKLPKENLDDLRTAKAFIQKEQGTKSMGFFMHAFKLCIFSIRFLNLFKSLYENKTYEAIMFFICDLGGDTDTNCCIVGGVIGPLLGFNNFGEKYITDTLSFVPVSAKNTIARPVIYSPGYAVFLILNLIRKLTSQELIQEYDYSNFELKNNKFESLKILLWLIFSQIK